MIITYDPAEISFAFGDHLVTDWAEDTQVKIEFNADSYSLTRGVKSNIRNRMHDSTAKVTISVQPQGLDNKALDSVRNIDLSSNAGTKSLIIKHQAIGLVFEAPDAWVMKVPDTDLSKEIGATSWVFETSFATCKLEFEGAVLGA